ncbi:uncharacterized protein LOC144579122 [Callithrix jacchus]
MEWWKLKPYFRGFEKTLKDEEVDPEKLSNLTMVMKKSTDDQSLSVKVFLITGKTHSHIALSYIRVGGREEGVVRKVEFSVDFCLSVGLLEEAQGSHAVHSPPWENSGCAGCRHASPRRGPFPQAAGASPRPGPRPSRPGGAARWIAGGVRESSGAGSRSAIGSGRGAAAAAPLEAGDVGEAVAAAAEAALRTRGKLLADRTPGRDVREPPLPPFTLERSWAQEGGPVLPGSTGQPARGGGGKPGSGAGAGSGPAGRREASAVERQPRCDVEGWRRRRCTRPRSGRLPGTRRSGVTYFFRESWFLLVGNGI